jgi:hypothetical protein
VQTRARGKHRDDFGVFGQFRGEEDDRNEHEQRTEEVREIGYEVQVIIKDNGPTRSIVGHKLIDMLVVVEHYRYGNYQCYREEVGSKKLLYYVPI